MIRDHPDHQLNDDMLLRKRQAYQIAPILPVCILLSTETSFSGAFGMSTSPSDKDPPFDAAAVVDGGLCLLSVRSLRQKAEMADALDTDDEEDTEEQENEEAMPFVAVESSLKKRAKRTPPAATGPKNIIEKEKKHQALLQGGAIRNGRRKAASNFAKTKGGIGHSGKKLGGGVRQRGSTGSGAQIKRGRRHNSWSERRMISRHSRASLSSRRSTRAKMSAKKKATTAYESRSFLRVSKKAVEGGKRVRVKKETEERKKVDVRSKKVDGAQTNNAVLQSATVLQAALGDSELGKARDRGTSTLEEKEKVLAMREKELRAQVVALQTWKHKQRALQAVVGKSMGDVFEEFQAASRESGAACSARMREAKHAFSELMERSEQLTRQVESSETILRSETTNLNITRAVFVSIQKEAHQRQENCQKVQEQARQEFQLLSQERRTLENMASPTARTTSENSSQGLDLLQQPAPPQEANIMMIRNQDEGPHDEGTSQEPTSLPGIFSQEEPRSAQSAAAHISLDLSAENCKSFLDFQYRLRKEGRQVAPKGTTPSKSVNDVMLEDEEKEESLKTRETEDKDADDDASMPAERKEEEATVPKNKQNETGTPNGGSGKRTLEEKKLVGPFPPLELLRCDPSEKMELQLEYTTTLTEVAKLQLEASKLMSEEMLDECRKDAKAWETANLAPNMVVQEESCARARKASSSIEALIPVLHEVHREADLLQNHYLGKDMLGKCEEARSLGGAIASLREMVLHLEKCPGGNKAVVLKEPMDVWRPELASRAVVPTADHDAEEEHIAH